MSGVGYLVAGWTLTPIVLAAYALRNLARMRALRQVLTASERD